MLHIPENYTDFLYWVRERTELFWSRNPDTSAEDFSCEKWMQGARWIGMKEEDINATEEKYGIRFMPEHREFLKILHTIDRKEEIEYNIDGKPTINKRPFFYNWLTDDEQIKEKLEWPYETILQDIQEVNNVWLQSWGKRPETDEAREGIFSVWFNKAPRLLPLTLHRFLVSESYLADRPVLSVWGSDIIVYGWDMRLYLLNELSVHLNLSTLVYFDEYGIYYPEDINELKEIKERAYLDAAKKHIPYWKEMIMYWTSGWASFGQKSPRDDGDTIHPIVKTNAAKGGEDDPKIFNSF